MGVSSIPVDIDNNCIDDRATLVRAIQSRLHSSPHSSGLLPLSPHHFPLRVLPEQTSSRAQTEYTLIKIGFEQFEYLSPEPTLEVAEVKALYQELGIEA